MCRCDRCVYEGKLMCGLLVAKSSISQHTIGTVVKISTDGYRNTSKPIDGY